MPDHFSHVDSARYEVDVRGTFIYYHIKSRWRCTINSLNVTHGWEVGLMDYGVVCTGASVYIDVDPCVRVDGPNVALYHIEAFDADEVS